MHSKSQKANWLGSALAVAILFGSSASASANPISRVAGVSKTAVLKTFDGAKSVVRKSGAVAKDVGTTAWSATGSVANRVRSLF